MMKQPSFTKQCRQAKRWLSVSLIGVLVLLACESTPRSSRMTVDDFEAMSQAMAQSLMASHAVAQRNANSPPWRIAMDRVENLTSDMMTPSEQWSIMARLQSFLPLTFFEQQKNMVFIVPPERTMQLMRQGDVQAMKDFAYARSVTHSLRATFRSVTRADRSARTDLYYCEFELLDLATNESVWTDRFEYKRVAEGKIWD